MAFYTGLKHTRELAGECAHNNSDRHEISRLADVVEYKSAFILSTSTRSFIVMDPDLLTLTILNVVFYYVHNKPYAHTDHNS